MNIKAKAERAFEIADRFLEEIGADKIEEIYLIGSYAEGTSKASSDVDFLIVGGDFDLAEQERIDRSEAGTIPRGLDVTVDVSKRPGHVDIIFSSSGPRSGQKSMKVYDESKGGWAW